MSIEANKAVARRMVAIYEQRDLDLIDEIVAPDFEGHFGEGIRGPDGMKQLVTLFLSAFPDLNVTVRDQVAEGDRVVTRWQMAGTHRGTFMGVGPTGRQVQWSGISIERLDAGRIAEAWPQMDFYGLMMQIGAV